MRSKILLAILLPILASCNFQPWHAVVIDSQAWKPESPELTNLPSTYGALYFESPVPRQYIYQDDALRVVASINPRRSNRAVNIQFEISAEQDIEVEASWAGDCGKIGTLGVFDPAFVLTNTLFDKKMGSILFVWMPGTGHCADWSVETLPAEASAYPIVFTVIDTTRTPKIIELRFRIVENGWIWRGFI